MGDRFPTSTSLMMKDSKSAVFENDWASTDRACTNKLDGFMLPALLKLLVPGKVIAGREILTRMRWKKAARSWRTCQVTKGHNHSHVHSRSRNPRSARKQRSRSHTQNTTHSSFHGTEILFTFFHTHQKGENEKVKQVKEGKRERAKMVRMIRGE